MLFFECIIIAHRGASGYEPENTLRSFERAIEMHAQAIELDIYKCASGELVVIHDTTLERTAHVPAKVKEVRWEILKMYDVGKGEHIPLLSQVLDLVNKRVIVNIEIKDDEAVEPLAKLITHYCVDKGWPQDLFIVSSFEHSALAAFYKFCPFIKVGVIFDERDTAHVIERANKYHGKYAIFDYHDITEKLITLLHSQGLKVLCYTVNDAYIAHELKDMRIDGIITDFPDIL